MEELAPGTVVDRYVVEARLGGGGMASVYRVRHAALGSHHALKVLHASSPEVRRRLLREGRVQATLAHPNIVAVTDVVDVQGAPGLVMQLVDGPTLESWIAEGSHRLAEAEEAFGGILDAVEAAHAVGVVHRDLKPANVLLQRVGGRLMPRVADFGLATAMEDESGVSLTSTGVTMGTPRYMSPEQIRSSRDVDQRADVFALGAILYELATGGRRAFDGPGPQFVWVAIQDGVYVPPLDVEPTLPGRIDVAIRGSLDPDRETRIPDCATLRRVVRGELDWNAPTPVPPAWVVPASERRNDTMAFSGEVPVVGPRPRRWPYLLIPVLLGLAAAAWMWTRPDEPAIVAADEGAEVTVAPSPVTAQTVPLAEPVIPQTKPEPLSTQGGTLPPAKEAHPVPTDPPPPAEVPEPTVAEPAPPTTGRFSATGADKVLLRGDAGTFRLGEEVPPGHYRVLATFGAQADVPAGEVSIRAGATSVLVCDAGFRSCDLRQP